MGKGSGASAAQLVAENETERRVSKAVQDSWSEAQTVIWNDAFSEGYKKACKDFQKLGANGFNKIVDVKLGRLTNTPAFLKKKR